MSLSLVLQMAGAQKPGIHASAIGELGSPLLPGQPFDGCNTPGIFPLTHVQVGRTSTNGYPTYQNDLQKPLTCGDGDIF